MTVVDLPDLAATERLAAHPHTEPLKAALAQPPRPPPAAAGPSSSAVSKRPQEKRERGITAGRTARSAKQPRWTARDDELEDDDD